MRKFSKYLVNSILLAAFSVVGVNNAIADNRVSVKTNAATVYIEKVFSGLDTPWALAMLPDGKMIATERDGRMVLLNPKNPKRQQTIKGLPKIGVRGQGGLLDVIPDRNFAQNNTIYFTYSARDRIGNLGTTLARATLNTGNSPWLENLTVLYSMPKKDRSGRHFGSRIVQADDGTLFFTIGDRGTQPRSQDPFDPAGSVMRINTDGSIPADNPHADGKKALPEVWSIGHRNPQGATLNPRTGELWTISHGARGGDEINIPKAGKNYGWPTISYGRNYSGTKIGVGQSASGLEQPIFYWDPSIAPSGADFYEGTGIPGWNGNLFVGALRGEALVRLTVDGNKITSEERLFEEELGRIRDVRYMPDGALWIVTNDGEGSIYRITGG
ncbi:MAG: PQQ-dependent sugar dehydrogenase [Rhizobiaceae bacterium]|nr:PQQ-dependent sugar dehydrogenase [Rhizobiaceae bacterium]